uniref:Uncharacterized protein n=1 Tax=Nelumbo nucifera TaxID=4432 RepID=A0A822Y7K2_NELNU|nr:TPA_asm: hypothetical protein HUJ06_029948 [Nelumbo nucifera]
MGWGPLEIRGDCITKSTMEWGLPKRVHSAWRLGAGPAMKKQILQKVAGGFRPGYGSGPAHVAVWIRLQTSEQSRTTDNQNKILIWACGPSPWAETPGSVLVGSGLHSPECSALLQSQA